MSSSSLSIRPLPFMSSSSHRPDFAYAPLASSVSLFLPVLRDALMPPAAVIDSELPVVAMSPSSAVAFHSTSLTSLTSSYLPYSNFCAAAGAAARQMIANTTVGRICAQTTRLRRLRNRPQAVAEAMSRLDEVTDFGLHQRATDAADELLDMVLARLARVPRQIRDQLRRA